MKFCFITLRFLYLYIRVPSLVGTANKNTFVILDGDRDGGPFHSLCGRIGLA